MEQPDSASFLAIHISPLTGAEWPQHFHLHVAMVEVLWAGEVGSKGAKKKKRVHMLANISHTW